MNKGIVAAQAVLQAAAVLVMSLLLSGASLNIGAIVVRTETPTAACQARYRQCLIQADGNNNRIVTCTSVRDICLQNCQE